MAMKKQLCALVRMVLPTTGFLLACLGAYLISQATEGWLVWTLIPAYITMGIGILAVMVGTFWSICNSKVYRGEGGGGEQHMQVYTIERPISFPPSYEESQSSELSPEPPTDFAVEVDGMNVVIGLAPPLYTLDSSVPPDCRWSWELPPHYSQVERDQQGEEEWTEEQRSGC